ncbi:hypothetical protein [Acidovorax sp. ACV01]|uniref:hypothetical protein n=1 Tax=Acidovorax sp. ACV01 TaxID=2769311 RepID=UPI0017871759|nr:hypothetical protein [Acidovorax sp. ACV01]MBD9395754.1 hypothetical protein [Acidovorax sp. ACV01]
MTRRRVHPFTWLVFWLGITVTALVLALVWVVSNRDVSEVQLNRAHLAGMELGQTMCLGFRSELERSASPQPAPRKSGGLL